MQIGGPDFAGFFSYMIEWIRNFLIASKVAKDTFFKLLKEEMEQ
jgi:hypothetical protein